MKLRCAALALGLLSLPALANGPAGPEAASAKAKDAKQVAQPRKAMAGSHAKHDADCHHPAEAVQAAPAPKSAEQGWVLTRGAPLTGAPAVELAALLKNPAQHDGKTVRLEGQVRKACEKKGCWMELAPDAKSPGVRVTFKDYGFFVPLDSAGSKARLEGVVKVAELSDGHAKHYEAEGGIVPRGKDGKAREVQLVASGVELRR